MALVSFVLVAAGVAVVARPENGGLPSQQITLEQLSFIIEQAQHQMAETQQQQQLEQEETLVEPATPYKYDEIHQSEDQTDGGTTQQKISKIDELAKNQTLAALSDENVNTITSDEQSVNILVICFTSPDTCPSDATRSLIGKCLSNCTILKTPLQLPRARASDTMSL